MSGQNMIILARPHPFIVEPMKETLKRNNYSPYAINRIQEISRPAAADIKGAIISTSVVSKIEESYVDVFNALRKKFPNIPIIFTTLVNAEQMSETIKKQLAKLAPAIQVMGLNSASLAGQILGEINTIIVLQKDDVTDANRFASVDKVIRNHFR